MVPRKLNSMHECNTTKNNEEGRTTTATNNEEREKQRADYPVRYDTRAVSETGSSGS